MTSNREEDGPGLDGIERLSLLEDANRRRLYGYVAAQDRPVTRDEASEALDLDRSTAAYHLDRLADRGLLAVSFARPDGVGGPGAGRPAKRYGPSGEEVTVSVPPRDYRLAAELLARGVDDDTTGSVRAALTDAARAYGRSLAGGREGIDLLEVLDRHGFRPTGDDGTVWLRNCPFHRLAREHTELICGMNLALLEGLVDAGRLPHRPRLDPAEGRCCVVLGRTPEPDQATSSGP